jgi:hypothetical protein
MNIQKIVGWIAVALAVVGAFVNIPYVAAVLLIAGLVVGYTINDEQVRVLVSALVLNGLAHAFDAIPGVGSYLSSIIASIGVFAVGAALIIVLRNLAKRLMP